MHGSGAVDLLFIDGWTRCAEVEWDDPAYARMLRRYGQFARVIRYDGRGSGMSDPDPTGRWSVLDAWARDAAGVLDAVGSERCAVYGNGFGGPLAVRFASRYADRVDALVLDTTWARLRRAPDQPFGLSDRTVERLVEAIQLRWGDGVMVDIVGLGHDEVTRAEAAREERFAASRGVAALLMRACFEADVRTDLAEIHAPTLVVHRHGPALDVGHGRALASGIRDATFEAVTQEDWSLIGETDEHPPGWIRIVSSSPVYGTRRTLTVCSRRCSSRTSSGPPRRLLTWVTASGSCSSMLTTPNRHARSADSVDGSFPGGAMASSRPSRPLAKRSIVHPRSGRQSQQEGSASALDSMPLRSS
jgi:pimeloyl-ACP methyl ester carboxylesterase